MSLQRLHNYSGFARVKCTATGSIVTHPHSKQGQHLCNVTYTVPAEPSCTVMKTPRTYLLFGKASDHTSQVLQLFSCFSQTSFFALGKVRPWKSEDACKLWMTCINSIYMPLGDWKNNSKLKMIISC